MTSDQPHRDGHVGAARRLGPHRSVFGESTIWDDDLGCVWTVDMHGHAIIQAFPDGDTRIWKTPAPSLPWARAVVLREGGGLIVALSDRLWTFDVPTGVFSPLPHDTCLPPGHLFNDAVVDSEGRLIIGTMLPGRGDDGLAIIQQYSAGTAPRTLFDGLNTTNGLAFSPDGATLYLSDSNAAVRTVWACDYKASTGDVSDRRTFVVFADLPGKPDGAAVDAEGGYWSAAMNARHLYRFTPYGALDMTLKLPVDTPTRPAFGGTSLDILYVSTGGVRNSEIDDGLKGAVFALPSPFAGMRSNRARL